ncbi:MAG: class I SAM-dependent methyltransferase [Magnetospirillum sp.]|nr:class I SAM-dependent methyltransferase [Magnetospirillum sp.]
MTMADVLNDFIYGGSPYEGLDLAAYPLDLQGWFEEPEVFDMIIDQVQPHVIIEVGSWKGTSAHHMINRALRYKDASIICIDTWLGASEHWLNPQWRAMLNIRAGRPTLHEQFMANVVHAGLQNRVTPLPLTSRLASMFLRELNLGGEPFTAPMIYIDGAHDEASVTEDINSYWPLLSPGGVMLGDDCAPPWTGVMNAVARFRAESADQILQTGNIKTRWFAQKVA